MISYVWALVAANLTACVVCSGYLLLAPKLASPFMGAIKSSSPIRRRRRNGMSRTS